MLVKVTKNHIKLGTRQNGNSCPVALALNDTLGVECHVGQDDFRVKLDVSDYDSWDEIPLPRSAQRFVNRFDSKKPVKPFSFKLK